jgi:L-amino acid N-acyltransferase YncA
VLCKFPASIGAKPQGFLKMRPRMILGTGLGRFGARIMAGVEIRDATAEDWPAIWPFLHTIVAAGETYAYDRDMTEEQARRLWMVDPPGRTVVAVDDAGAVVGTANMYANRPGPGSHVASTSFMVDPGRAGRGTGRALGKAMLQWARERGFRAVQFNAVVETNERAVRLWQSLGFTVIGTVPEAFAHPRHGYVGLHVMHRFL